ncbi:MAG: thiamine phosphate synthase [Sphingomonas sp.]|nr:thiamine phosphate synthase [Sphingomonas sp.]
MTDARQGEGLWRALDRLPRGGWVIFRHYELPKGERRALFERVRRVARARGLRLLVAGEAFPGADGVHGRDPRRRRGLRSWPAHDAREVIAGARAGADLILISPVFPTRSHPGAPTLGPLRAMRLARRAKGRAVALGGMDARRYRRLRGFVGWAGIDAWG